MSKNDLNFELNLLPVISLLAVLICFLLLTTAWIHIGSIDVAQAVGGQSQDQAEKKPELWVNLDGDSLSFELKNVKAQFKKLEQKKAFSSKYASKYFNDLKGNIENLNIALISPSKKTDYGKVIEIIDLLKSEKINEVGVNPL